MTKSAYVLKFSIKPFYYIYLTISYSSSEAMQNHKCQLLLYFDNLEQSR